MVGTPVGPPVPDRARVLAAAPLPVIGMVASVVSVAMTARYLGPSLYGQLTIAVVFIGMWTSFADLGIGTVIVRRVTSGRGEPRAAGPRQQWVIAGVLPTAGGVCGRIGIVHLSRRGCAGDSRRHVGAIADDDDDHAVRTGIPDHRPVHRCRPLRRHQSAGDAGLYCPGWWFRMPASSGSRSRNSSPLPCSW